VALTAAPEKTSAGHGKTVQLGSGKPGSQHPSIDVHPPKFRRKFRDIFYGTRWGCHPVKILGFRDFAIMTVDCHCIRIPLEKICLGREEGSQLASAHDLQSKDGSRRNWQRKDFHIIA